MTEEQALIKYKARCLELLQEKTVINYLKTSKYEYFNDILTEEDFKKAIRLKNRKSGKRRRCYKKLEKILDMYEDLYFNQGIYCNLVFGTCTFDNKSMNWKEETRTKKINKWIKQHFVIALANIDYGEKTEREHHHFIGLTFEEIEPTGKKSKTGFDLYELKEKNYNLGFEPNLERIEVVENERKISNYLVKINYHSNKKSTLNRRIRVLK